MAREIVAPTTNEKGRESHPAWAMIRAYRGSQTPGAVLFDSDIRHNHTVTIVVEEADRKRDLNHDHVMGWSRILEIEMSEAQWASFVSAMNTSGVPATLRFRESREDPFVPEMPYEPRLAESMREVHEAGERMIEQIREAFAAYEKHKTVGNLRHLKAMIENTPANMDFAAKSLSEHAENVVQRARADIEAFVVTEARRLGIEPGDLATPPELTTGE